MEVLNKKFQYFKLNFHCLNKIIFGIKNSSISHQFFSALEVKKGKKTILKGNCYNYKHY
jgi:hypothetical protein